MAETTTVRPRFPLITALALSTAVTIDAVTLGTGSVTYTAATTAGLAAFAVVLTPTICVRRDRSSERQLEPRFATRGRLPVALTLFVLFAVVRYVTGAKTTQGQQNVCVYV